MKTLYIDCGMGAAGDMLTAALLELMPDKQAYIDKLNNIGIDGVKFVLADSEKCGIKGSHINVLINGDSEEDELDHSAHADSTHHNQDHHHDQEHHNHEHHHDHNHDCEHEHQEHHHHEHHHSSLKDITEIVNSLNISDKVKKDVVAVYNIIAEAEGHVHGKEVNEIHFHEVGNKDAIADITAVCMLFEDLKFDRVVASPVHVGSGHVHCAHGILPVPAPATAYILNDVPMYSEDIKGELCTPTGAALLKYFVTEFGPMPSLKAHSTGYGMGKKDFPRCNAVRVVAGESSDDEVVELMANIDDMTGEEIGFASESILSEGALDVYVLPIYMKKNRPGYLLGVLCKPSDKEKIVKAIFKNTRTLGIREQVKNRYILDRDTDIVNTLFGDITIKRSEGYGSKTSKYEYEDLVKIAKERNISLLELKDELSGLNKE